MTRWEITLLTSRIIFVIALLVFTFSISVLLIDKKNRRDFLFLTVYSAIIVILAKLNVFVPFN